MEEGWEGTLDLWHFFGCCWGSFGGMVVEVWFEVVGVADSNGGFE